MFKGFFSAVLFFALTEAATAEPVYVFRPPNLPSHSKILPVDAFRVSPVVVSPGPSVPGPMHPENPHSPPMPLNPGNDPSVVMLVSEYWGMDFANFRKDYVAFDALPDMEVQVSLSGGKGFRYTTPQSATSCFVRSRWGLGVLWTMALAGWNQEVVFKPLKVGTYNMVFECEGHRFSQPVQPPFADYGSLQRVKVVAVP